MFWVESAGADIGIHVCTMFGKHVTVIKTCAKCIPNQVAIDDRRNNQFVYWTEYKGNVSVWGRGVWLGGVRGVASGGVTSGCRRCG